MTTMAEWLPLAIFPEGFTYSLLTPVLIGVLFMAFATETFGGGFSGLVVPGYLAPIYLLNPAAGLVITLQAVATYLIVRALSDGGCRLGFWSVFFGRDRFLALVIVGTLLRAVTEGYVLPMVFLELGDAWPQAAALRSNLHSIGLICVPLLANMFWKTGVLDGIPPVMLPIGATYLAMRFVLMPLTNFSVSRIELAYDSFAIDLLANPKSYILLMTGMVLASKAALRYGWDFNGIMVPALVCLTWFEPGKLVATCIEAFVIYKVTRRVVKLGIFENVTIEGPRKTLAAFLVGYGLKFGAAHVAVSVMPGLNPLDLFGFGYMLPTLLAVKMIQRENAALVLGPTLLVSGISALLGNAAGFLLMLTVPTASWLPVTVPARSGSPAVVEPAAPVADLALRLAFDGRLLLPRESINAFARPWPHEENAFSSAVVHLRRAMEGQASWDAALREADGSLAGLEMATARVGELVYLSESRAAPKRPRGGGIYAFRRQAGRRLIVQVPHPLADPGAVELAASLFEALDAAALFVAGAHPETNIDGSADVLVNPRTLFQAAHRVFRHYDVLSVRRAASGPTELAAVSEVPAALPLDRLRSVLGKAEVTWRHVPGRHCQAETAARGFAQLFYDDEALALVRRARYGDAPLPETREGLPELLARADAAAQAQSSPPTTACLQFLDAEVIGPLTRLAAPGPLELARVTAMAAHVGYELAWWHEPPPGTRRALLLRERVPASRRWGTYLFAGGPSGAPVIEAPEPVRELRTASVAATLFQALAARALLLDEGRAPGAPWSAASLFQLVHQALARDASGAGWTVQIRGFAGELHPDVAAEMVVTPKFAGAGAGDSTSGPVGLLLEAVRKLGHQVALQDHSRQLAPFEDLVTPQESYNTEFGAGPFLYLHVSDRARRSYRTAEVSAEEEKWNLSFLDALKIPRRRGSLLERSAEPMMPGTVPERFESEMKEGMESFVRSRNPLQLAQVTERLRGAVGRVEHFRDAPTGQEVYVLDWPGKRLLVHSSPRGFQARGRAGAGERVRALGRFLLGRELMLELTGSP
ncbi:MAG: poly-gamma-glutamate biosynthesis protein PgsC/CapC [Candidatus Wallbacteria bacterium]|nr:poly-gamma-glutamate biosynthesis protein PgsC/CapC [Candidatus Wallbacteria bacterium]